MNREFMGDAMLECMQPQYTKKDRMILIKAGAVSTPGRKFHTKDFRHKMHAVDIDTWTIVWREDIEERLLHEITLAARAKVKWWRDSQKEAEHEQRI
jgi:hypothetical protein